MSEDSSVKQSSCTPSLSYALPNSNPSSRSAHLRQRQSAALVRCHQLGPPLCHTTVQHCAIASWLMASWSKAAAGMGELWGGVARERNTGQACSTPEVQKAAFLAARPSMQLHPAPLISPEARAGDLGLAGGRLPPDAGALRGARGVRIGLGGGDAACRAAKQAVTRAALACWEGCMQGGASETQLALSCLATSTPRPRSRRAGEARPSCVP